MLGKLLKYEIKATARLFVPLYLAVLLFSLISKYINPFQTGLVDATNKLNLQAVIGMISSVIYFALVVGIIVMTVIIMILRFYKNLLGDEGYLLFTLPVKSWQLIISKLLTSLMWTILSFLAVVCSILILVNAKEVLDQLWNAVSQIQGYFGKAAPFFIPVYALVGAVYYIIAIYDAIALGHLVTKHRILASFGAYILLHIISQMALSGVTLFFFANIIVSPSGTAINPTPSQIQALTLSILCVFAILAAGNFLFTNWILKNKLNLE